CVAVAALTHVFLPPMKSRGRGAIIIVASAAAYQPLGLAATYGATKAFDLMFGEALWAENQGTGVDGLVVSPGPVETEFQTVAGGVPYFDLTTQYAALRDEILGAFDRVCRQATFVLGEEVARFDERGIGTAVHYPTPVHRQRAYAGLDLAPGSLPHTGRACARVLSLPFFPETTRAPLAYTA